MDIKIKLNLAYYNKKDKKMRYIRFLFLGILILSFTSCSLKPQIKKSKSLLVTLKTKKIAYQDTGFMKSGENYLNLQIFSLGNLIMDMTINPNGICLNSYCMDKESFNRKYLSKYYPDTLLENVLKGKPIFKGENLKEQKDGFIQKIEKKGRYSIVYKALNGKILFKDRLNKIIILIKPIKS